MYQETIVGGTSCNLSKWIYDVFKRALQIKRTPLGAQLKSLSFGNICCPSERENRYEHYLPSYTDASSVRTGWYLHSRRQKLRGRLQLPHLVQHNEKVKYAKQEKNGSRDNQYLYVNSYNLNVYVSLMFSKFPNQKRKISYILLHLFHV